MSNFQFLSAEARPFGRRSVGVLLSLVFFLAACGEPTATTPSPEPATATSAVEAPTEVPTPEATAAPEATVAPEVTAAPEATTELADLMIFRPIVTEQGFVSVYEQPNSQSQEIGQVSNDTDIFCSGFETGETVTIDNRTSDQWVVCLVTDQPGYISELLLGEPPVMPPPSFEPSGDALFPREFLALSNGQIVRFSIDGTSTAITNEEAMSDDALAVVQMAQSPLNGKLAYVVQRSGGTSLILIDPDGSNRVVLLEEEGTWVRNLVWHPTEPLLAVSQFQVTEDGIGNGGVSVIEVESGAINLIRADDPLPPTEGELSYLHAPFAWSPDGTRLLVDRFAQQIDICDAAVMNLADGEVVPFERPTFEQDDRLISCSTGLWNADGSAVYLTINRVGTPWGDPGIWQADPNTGAMTQLAPFERDGGVDLFTALKLLPDGDLLAVYARTAELPPAFLPEEQIFNYQLARVDVESGAITPIGDLGELQFALLRWDTDNNGVFIIDNDPTSFDGRVRWYDFDTGFGEPLIIPALDLNSLIWL